MLPCCLLVGDELLVLVREPGLVEMVWRVAPVEQPQAPTEEDEDTGNDFEESHV